jgi:hypothetical protein
VAPLSHALLSDIVCQIREIFTPQCDISNNIASDAGGIAGSEYSNITVDATTLTSNEGNGAAILTSGNLSIYESYVRNNRGDGGLLIDKRYDETLPRLVSIQKTEFSGNTAEVGAAIILSADITVSITKVSGRGISCICVMYTYPIACLLIIYICTSNR